MGDDHLDKETAVSVRITETGLQAAAKSRFIAAADRLLGNIFEKRNATAEAEASAIRTKAATRNKIIEAMGDMTIEKLKTDPEFFERALESDLNVTFRRFENKEAVVQLAAQDLRYNPPTDERSAPDEPKLSDAFTDRLGRYAEDATDEQAREKWAKVLAAEVRTPGTFSAKTMRIIDEIDPDVARLFERLCRNRVENGIIKCLSGELTFADRAALVSADLLIEPGIFGQRLKFESTADSQGKRLWLAPLGTSAVVLPQEAKANGRDENNPPITISKDEASIPVYVLTDVGLKLSSIIPHNQKDVIDKYLDLLSKYVAPHPVDEYQSVGSGEWQPVRRYQGS
jgi:hypothetical protein